MNDITAANNFSLQVTAIVVCYNRQATYDVETQNNLFEKIDDEILIKVLS